MSLLRNICCLKDPVIEERYQKCLNVPEKFVRSPDPCIYAQRTLTDNNDQIRWENVDIRLFDVSTGGFVNETFGLTQGNTYRIEVTVHNCTAQFAAHNTKVELFFAPFGIGSVTLGLTGIPLPQSHVHIPAGGVVTLNTNWVAAQPSVSLVAVLSHPDDDNTANNEGWHIVRTDEADPAQGGSPIFPLWNPFNGMRFIKVLIVEEGPEQWFPEHEINIGRFDQFLPVGELPESLSHIIQGHLSGLNFDIPDATPPGTLHVSHITAYALPELDGPRTLVGGVTYRIVTL